MHSPLIISTSTGTQYFAAVAVLDMYVAHNLNGLDAYTWHTVLEQDLVVARHKRKNYMHANVIREYIALVLLVSISHIISQATHMRVSSLN